MRKNSNNFFAKICKCKCKYNVHVNVNKIAYQFLNYLNAALMRYCLHHFPRG
jgi:hypothetical protein